MPEAVQQMFVRKVAMYAVVLAQGLSGILSSSDGRFTLTPADIGMCSIAFPASTMSAQQQDQEVGSGCLSEYC